MMILEVRPVSYPKQSFLAMFLGLTVALSATGTQAAYQTFTVTSSGTAGMSLTNLAQTLAIPAFNPLSGTLESVVISAVDKAQISASITNNAAAAETFSVTDTVNFSLAFNGTTILNDQGHVVASKTYTSLAKGGSASFGTYNLTNSTGPNTIIDPTLLSALTGTGTVNLAFAANASVGTGGSGGNVFISPTTMAGAIVTVTYNFISPNIVPEPASVAMTAVGMLLAAGMGWHRNRARARSTETA
jgi:hypothetical protein